MARFRRNLRVVAEQFAEGGEDGPVAAER